MIQTNSWLLSVHMQVRKCFTSEINMFICERYNRQGQLCGSCMPGYALPVYSYYLSCVNCTTSNSAKYIAVYWTASLLSILSSLHSDHHLLQLVYLKVNKHAHLCFGIKQFPTLWCMILGHSSRTRRTRISIIPRLFLGRRGKREPGIHCLCMLENHCL